MLKILEHIGNNCKWQRANICHYSNVVERSCVALDLVVAATLARKIEITIEESKDYIEIFKEDCPAIVP